jgi:hypothetical protein
MSFLDSQRNVVLNKAENKLDDLAYNIDGKLKQVDGEDL